MHDTILFIHGKKTSRYTTKMFKTTVFPSMVVFGLNEMEISYGAEFYMFQFYENYFNINIYIFAKFYYLYDN